MDHFGPGIEYLDINTDGDHVNFTCFSEKSVNEDGMNHLAVLKITSIAVETDEFDDIDVEDKLHIVISVKDFRAIVQHAGITGNAISARYSLPAKPILLSYTGDALACEFLIMTVGERGSNPAQKTKKGRKATAVASGSGPRLEAASRRTSSVASNETAANVQPDKIPRSTPSSSKPMIPNATPHPQLISAVRASASRIGAFDLRPSQKPPPPTIHSESLFVDDDGWEPMRDEEEDAEQDVRLEWDHSADPKNPSALQLRWIEERHGATVGRPETADAKAAPESTYLEPTQKLSDIKSLALFPD
ncbi:DNA repair protein RAD9 [Metarhizium album ARSEF 1941]|uniref:DNA repair protein RAD9 n=1 Tax=Metarhizium album (strain ARSEF 1941) TaxID=1081103 RepID=A0A0B2X474_METAS|nr:DNA repair protein RAD9 [Metarhizium album ARSEF 1941]KHO01154.1 DNA repair protein RAD9 [Metarhizium album ARSEF 1941]